MHQIKLIVLKSQDAALLNGIEILYLEQRVLQGWME